jgi:hypothetical protein
MPREPSGCRLPQQSAPLGCTGFSLALASESVADFVDDLPKFRARPGVRRFYDESQAMLAEARSKARELKPLYHSWLGGDREGLFAVFEENGAARSAEAWAELASACLARAVWAECVRTSLRRSTDAGPPDQDNYLLEQYVGAPNRRIQRRD